ncbi:phosphorelay protein [Rhynchospora pubera]|uniref:Phosphorelay protein n=1 Tax=Rhynchospora pubera TaxID=906938 RepID=A0AAV8G0D5_9POAL|nr:phosphorelay protein [Rhynchospora pubera]
MDPKGAAKSKRGHSLHGRRTHPTPSAAAAKKKASSSSSSSKGVEAPRARPRPELPSNWDRYDGDEEEEEETQERGEAQAQDSTETEILAKSKGADYRYLIQQARSQPQPQPQPQPIAFSFEFLQASGSSSMLSARGEMLLSSCEDDNFIVDDYAASASSNYQVSFLSMDLNALAGQLSKLKMSQRLFLEDHHLFLEETLVPEPKENSQQPDRSASLDDCSNAGRENVPSSHISVEKIQSLASTSESLIETKLDVLINSFEETKISRGSENSANASIDLLDKQCISSLDDALDDLLAETSLSFNDKISGSVSSKKDKLEVLDESVDDLLGQAVMNVKNENRVESSVDVLPSSVPAKPVDDFDSWFDSL